MTGAILKPLQERAPESIAKWDNASGDALRLLKSRNKLAHGSVTDVGKITAAGIDKHKTIFAPYWGKSFFELLKNNEWREKHGMLPRDWMSEKNIQTFSQECMTLSQTLLEIYSGLQPVLLEALAAEHSSKTD